jgi:hypothetical protein
MAEMRRLTDLAQLCDRLLNFVGVLSFGSPSDTFQFIGGACSCVQLVKTAQIAVRQGDVAAFLTANSNSV